jgi:serine phosphatase RsbU (regulator of sigma subunit)
MRHGPVVGAVEGLVYGEDKLKFRSEDLLLAFTDGVTEEIDVNDELYGDMRLETLLSEMTDVSVERSVQDVVASVREFQGESAQDDDITVLALQFHA